MGMTNERERTWPRHVNGTPKVANIVVDGVEECDESYRCEGEEEM
jgi:hypothetical protein